MGKSFIEQCVTSAECIEKNDELKKMYAAWLNQNKEFIEQAVAQNGKCAKTTEPLRLTCTDAYIKHRVMMIGKEAHCNNGNWNENNLWDSESNLILGGYEYEEEILNRKANNTEYLKIRKIVSGCDEKSTSTECMAALVNNLNKVSDNGHYTKCDWKLNKGLYSGFGYEGYEGGELTVFEHEFRILKPETIIIFCGKKYDEHVIRCLGDKDESKIVKEIAELKAGDHTISDELRIRINNGNEYSEYNVYLAIHPSAHMTKDVRNIYKEQLKSIVEHK